MASCQRSRSLAISERIYRCLLTLYPAAFRREYGEPLVQAFRDCCRVAQRQPGCLGIVIFWLPILGDLASNALAERLSEVLRMFASSSMGKNLVASVIVGTIWGPMNHFLDDLVAAIPRLGPSLVSGPTESAFVPSLILALAVAWYNTQLQRRTWIAGITCAALWGSGFLSFFLYDVYRYWPRYAAGTVSLGWGWVAFFALSLLGGFSIGWTVAYIRGHVGSSSFVQ